MEDESYSEVNFNFDNLRGPVKSRGDDPLHKVADRDLIVKVETASVATRNPAPTDALATPTPKTTTLSSTSTSTTSTVAATSATSTSTTTSTAATSAATTSATKSAVAAVASATTISAATSAAPTSAAPTSVAPTSAAPTLATSTFSTAGKTNESVDMTFYLVANITNWVSSWNWDITPMFWTKSAFNETHTSLS